jgi:DNA excision repair protein ERCC-2
MAIVIAKKFLRSMAQPFEHNQLGVSLLTKEDIEARQKAAKANQALEKQGQGGQRYGPVAMEIDGR